MDPFTRSIITGIVFTLTIAGLLIDWLTGLDIPAWAWLLWVGVTGGWAIYTTQAASREGKSRAAHYDQAIAEMVRRAQAKK